MSLQVPVGEPFFGQQDRSAPVSFQVISVFLWPQVAKAHPESVLPDGGVPGAVV